MPAAREMMRVQQNQGGCMHAVFNAIMRVVSSLIGLLMVAMGTVWMLQGLNLAFRVGFMVGDRRWVLYGAILALIGVAQVVWSNTRQISHPSAS
jgi:drug/metabolite transporter superfamily protein YnfA